MSPTLQPPRAYFEILASVGVLPDEASGSAPPVSRERPRCKVRNHNYPRLPFESASEYGEALQAIEHEVQAPVSEPAWKLDKEATRLTGIQAPGRWSVERDRQRLDGKRTFSLEGLTEGSHFEPAAEELDFVPPNDPGFDLEVLLKVLSPAERAVAEVMLADDRGVYGKIQRASALLEKNPKNVDALWRRGLKKIRQELVGSS